MRPFLTFVARVRAVVRCCTYSIALWSHHIQLHSSIQLSVIISFLSFLLPDHGVIRSDSVFNAMLATDRGLYSRDYPYADSPQSIGT